MRRTNGRAKMTRKVEKTECIYFFKHDLKKNEQPEWNPKNEQNGYEWIRERVCWAINGGRRSAERVDWLRSACSRKPSRSFQERLERGGGGAAHTHGGTVCAGERKPVQPIRVCILLCINATSSSPIHFNPYFSSGTRVTECSVYVQSALYKNGI